MTRRQTSLAEIFETQIDTLALTLRPDTVRTYRSGARSFLSYLRVAFPQLRQLSQLRRDPHLPRPLSLQEDQLLQQELRRTDDLYANALLLIRATGMRVGECVHLPLDCLRQVGSEQWALHVPLGKLHTERLVPVDPEVRKIVERILTLRTSSPQLAGPDDFLLPHPDARHRGILRILRLVLARAAQRAGCVSHVVPHRLRHSFATEMLRLGVSLPALMKLLGHR